MDREWTFLPEAAAPFMLAAAQAIGLPADAVTSPPPGAAAGGAQALGRELLRMVLGTQDGGVLPDVLAELVRDPDGQQAQEWLTEQAFEVFESDLAAADRAAAAVAAFHRRRADAGDVQALVDLGDLLYWDEPEAARAAYQEAVDAGHQHALLDLAKVVRREDEDAALAVLQQAAGSTDPDLSAEAMYDIADMHLSRQDADAAAAMFHQVIDTRHPEWAAAAMIGLGNVLRRRGDRDGAEALYRKAIQTGGKGSAHACWLLGHLLKGKGDLTGAEAAWQHGIEDGSSPSAGAAFTSLVNLLEHQGDVEGLRAAYLTGAALNNPDALYALTQLGQLLESQGDITGAQAAWQQAIDGGCEDPDYWRERMSPPPKRRPEPAPYPPHLPAEFNPRNMIRTSREVLEHGLLPLPQTLTYDMAIPVAYWKAEQFAVVLVLRFSSHGHDNPHAMAMQVTYSRAEDGSWTSPEHVGGTSFHHDPIADPAGKRGTLDDRPLTYSGGSSWGNREVPPGRPAVIATGKAGPQVKYLAVIQGGLEDRRPLESHFGAWVACTEQPEPFDIVGLDHNGDVLARIPFRPDES